MRAVVYSPDLEALTVIWLAPWALEMLERGEVIAYAATPSFHTHYDISAVPERETCHIVRLRGERLRVGRHGSANFAQTWMLIADSDFALQLRAVFLPGQQGLVREREQKAKVEGVMQVINWLGGPQE